MWPTLTCGPHTATTPKTTLKTTPKTTLTKRQKNILLLIKKNNQITREELAEKVSLTKDGVQYNLKVLKEKGYIKRIGKSHNGYWEVLDK